MEQFLSIIQWLLPSGGIGALLLWLTSRTLRQARESREVHDAYKTMYEDVRQTLTQQSNEYQELVQRCAHLERAVLRIGACSHYPHCPVVHELRNTKRGYTPDIRKLLRKHEPTAVAEADNRSSTGRDADVVSAGGEPP